MIIKITSELEIEFFTWYAEPIACNSMNEILLIVEELEEKEKVIIYAEEFSQELYENKRTVIFDKVPANIECKKNKYQLLNMFSEQSIDVHPTFNKIFLDETIATSRLRNMDYSGENIANCIENHLKGNKFSLRKKEEYKYLNFEKDSQNYCIRYKKTESKRKEVLFIFKNLNLSNAKKDDEVYEKFDSKSCKKFVFDDTLTGYGGFYIHSQGIPVIKEFSETLNKLIEEENLDKKDITFVGDGSGAIAAYVYACELGINSVVTYNCRLNITDLYNLKKESIRGNLSDDELLKMELKLKDIIINTERKFDYQTQSISDFKRIKYMSELNIISTTAKKFKKEFKKI